MGGVIGLDVGGANTKARLARRRRAAHRLAPVRGLARPRDAHRRRARRRRRGGGGEPVGLVALTTTAELSDAFRTKREGVAFVLDAVEAALPGPTLVFTTAGELVDVAEARERPLEVAAANWVASALAVGAVHPRRADARRRQHDGRRDPGRRRARRRRGPHGPRPPARGRAPLHRRAAHEPRDDRAARPGARAAGARSPPSCSRSAPTSTSCSGHLAPDAYTCPTPDGRAATVAARARAHRPARLRRRRPARARRDRRDRRLPPRRAGPARSRRPRGRSPARRRRRRAGRRPRRRRVPRPRGGRRLGARSSRCRGRAAERDAAPAAALAGLAAARVRAAC